MTERVKGLERKLNECMGKESDEEISKYLRKMMEASKKVLSLSNVEWKRDIDGAANDKISQVINLVEEVEDIVDLYCLHLSSKDKRLGRANSTDNVNELSSKIQQYLDKDRDCPPTSRLYHLAQLFISFPYKIMGSSAELQLPDLLKEFSKKVCKDLKDLMPEETEEKEDLVYESDSCNLNIQYGLNQSKSKLVGTQKDIHSSLFDKKIESASSLVSVAVTGICGIGKTYHAEAVFKRVKYKFDCYAWINTHGKSTFEILQQMWMAFNKSQSVSPPRKGSLMGENEMSLSLRIQSYLVDKEFLLVLDDIPSVTVWESVKEAFPKNNTRGKILLTSRTSEKFLDCMHIKVKPLESANIVELLREHIKVPDGNAYFIKSIMKKLIFKNANFVERISMLLDGNPLDIKIVGGMLNSIMRNGNSELNEWHKRIEDVKNTKQDNGEQTSFIPLCYAALPPVLKSCFLYAALFPPQSQINCKRLMRLWIAEGFIDDEKDINEREVTMEEIAEQQLHELLRRNLFQVTKLGTDGKPIFCQLLRPLQEFAIKRSQEDGFLIMSEVGSSLTVKRPLRLSLIARHSQSNMNIDKNNQSRLRSLLVLQANKLQTSFIKPEVFSCCKLLRVLELQDMPIDALPDSIGKLFLIRYLGLRGTKLTQLPKFLHELKDLQTLDIRNTMVRYLPENLEHLTELRHLLLAHSFDDKAVNLPVVIADFKHLQTLAGVELTEGVATSLVELPQLQKLSVGKVKSDMLELLAKSINQMVSLRSLSINCDLGEKIDSKFFELSSTTNIEKLRVRGKILQLLSWVKTLKSLRCLHIRDSVLTEDPFLELGDLPKLEFLSVRKAYIGHSIKFQSKAFPNLKKLSLIHLPALSEWQIGDGAVKKLEKLTIESCPKLTKLPSYFTKLDNFRVLQVRRMPEAFIKTPE